MGATLLTEFWGVYASVEKYSVKVREGLHKGFLSETFPCFLCSSGWLAWN